MRLRHFHVFPAVALTVFAFPASAEESGKQLYTTYCSACHAPDGKGATGGAFPPLAKSPWVQGEPHRAIQTILHGLTGKVEVLDKTYDLEMPPQGAVLNDQQIASILTYVRSSWGNKGKPVSEAMVKSERSATSKRNKPWTAPEILKVYPLPHPKSPISDLIRTTYEGKWGSLPDFKKLKSTSVEEEHHGILNLDNIAAKDHFAVVWEGQLNVPKDGTYKIVLASDDESALFIGGKKISEVKGLGALNDAKRSKTTKVALKQGETPIRIEYFEYQGNQGISLSWTGPGIKGTQWMSTPQKSQKKRPLPVIDISPTGSESVIYNNFLNNTTPRSLAVGHPNGANYAFSTRHCAIELLWSGKFINAAQHWIARGVGRTDPAGTNLIKLGSPVGFVSESPARFKGYTLDKLRRPTLKYLIGEHEITDAPMPGDKPGQMVRTITIKGSGTLPFIAAKGIKIESKASGGFVLGDTWLLTTDAKSQVTADSLTLEFTPGTHTLTYTLIP
ncbi:hypothetical protein NT6N_16720 [Oceaniferula spumae]|uniref:PA14 domain-containing protein n=1 Tax=Oceaniferula spumae TaxID=2979115 RepID=A0AAT9FL23_9BACT